MIFMMIRTLADLRYSSSVWILLGCGLLTVCGPKLACMGQVRDEAELHREAEKLLRTAAEAMRSGKYETTLEKAKQVAELLPKDWRVQQRAAELIYLSGYAKESLPLFDLANALSPQRAADNWQRGIALATAGDFKRGAEQFKLHREVNPNDVENSAWYFLCIAKSEGLEVAKKSVIPSGGDPRPPMMNILKMLDGVDSPQQVLDFAEKVGPSLEQQKSAQFYANLYVGLYYDSIGRDEDAVKYLKSSLEYGIGGYMADTARVYLKSRFHNSKNSDPNKQR